MTTPKWRERVTSETIYGTVGREAAWKWINGEIKYGSSHFTGDPLDHLDEELADAPNYSLCVRRQRQAFVNWMLDAISLLEVAGEHDDAYRRHAQVGTELLVDSGFHEPK